MAAVQEKENQLPCELPPFEPRGARQSGRHLPVQVL